MAKMLSPSDVRIGQLFVEDCSMEVFKAIDLIPFHGTTGLVGEVVGYIVEPRHRECVLSIGTKDTFAGTGAYGPELYLVDESKVFTPVNEN